MGDRDDLGFYIHDDLHQSRNKLNMVATRPLPNHLFFKSLTSYIDQFVVVGS